MLLLSADDIWRAVPMRLAMDAVALALQEFSLGRAIAPVRMSISVAAEQATALFMPGFVEAAGGLGVKFVSVFPNNRDRGKRTVHGLVVLADPTSGEPLAVLEASSLTVLRTGAAAGVATRLLAREDATSVAVIGTGAQAHGLVEAVCAARPIREIRLYNRTPERALAFAERLRNSGGGGGDTPHLAGEPGKMQEPTSGTPTETGASQRPAVFVTDSPEEAVTGADIVVTATTSLRPVFLEHSLSGGTTVIGVGSFTPSMQELPSVVVSRADKVVVESREAALSESGDLIIPIREGVFHADRIHAELGEIAAGLRPGRERPNELVVFKSVGLSVMDLVVGKLAYDRALALGLGQKVAL
ncbi:NAD(P)-binding domain-containing protein [Alicyclobacillus macrosporangiidus]|uniref:NAD(P)-binding domain-containing protein n=1 Tax=Alicyclobacillus macrosporangiidus TaxID=392015 RepID=UPI0004976A89|nr:NAD(P)-binding domain-containing protein [Alicyclobacillus macrosporangiidus]